MRVNRPEKLMWGPKQVILLITGIGPVNAALALGRIVGSDPGLGGVLNLGIAGSFRPDNIPIGSVVSVETEIWPEFGLYTENGLDPRGLGLGQGRIQGRVVWDRLGLHPQRQAQRMGLELDSNWPQVVSLSVAGVSGTSSRAAELQARTGAEVENMEGFALAWACVVHDLPFVQVRSISNLVGSRDEKEWDMDLALNVLQAAAKRLVEPMQDPLSAKKQ